MSLCVGKLLTSELRGSDRATGGKEAESGLRSRVSSSDIRTHEVWPVYCASGSRRHIPPPRGGKWAQAAAHAIPGDSGWLLRQLGVGREGGILSSGFAPVFCFHSFWLENEPHAASPSWPGSVPHKDVRLSRTGMKQVCARTWLPLPTAVNVQECTITAQNLPLDTALERRAA